MIRFLSKKDVRQKIGLSHASIDRMEAGGQFPKRVSIGFRVFWVESEIDDWMKARIAKRDRPTD